MNITIKGFNSNELNEVAEDIKEDLVELLKEPKYKNFILRELITAPKEVNVHLGKNVNY